MTPERYNQIVKEHRQLTGQEIAEGWHYCREWNHMLVGPGMEEYTACGCLRKPICPACED